MLERYGVAVLGTLIRTIEETEDRALFTARLGEIGVEVPRSAAAPGGGGPLRKANRLPRDGARGLRARGLGSGLCVDEAQLVERVAKARPQPAGAGRGVPRRLEGARIRGCARLASITASSYATWRISTRWASIRARASVAPSQTLTNREYHAEEIAIRTVRHLGVVGECNIQFALCPRTGAYRAIEVNARLAQLGARLQGDRLSAGLHRGQARPRP